jgi:hypothetical protein
MEHIQEGVHSGFEMEVNGPYSLNYLIAVQNIYLNNKNKERERPLFPYVDSSKWGILDANFEKTFTEVWTEAVDKNSQSGLYDHGVFDFDKELYQKLFENNETGAFGYSESIKFFQTWWSGIYGKIAIESVFDEDRMNKVYRELSTSINTNKRLRIHLIFDRPFSTLKCERSWYAVLPIEDIFITKKRPEVITNLLKCCKAI